MYKVFVCFELEHIIDSIANTIISNLILFHDDFLLQYGRANKQKSNMEFYMRRLEKY